MSRSTNFDFMDNSQSPFNQYSWGGYSSDELATRYFSQYSDPVNNTTVITDTVEENEELEAFIQEYYYDLNRNRIIGDEGDELALTLKIFVSKQGSELIEAYEKCTLAYESHEVVLFLEDNAGDEESAPFYAVKMSTKAREVLQKYSTTRQDVKDSANEQLRQAGAEPIDEKFLAALLRNQPLEAYANLGVYDIIGKALTTINVSGKAVANASIWVLDYVINFLKDKKIGPESWLPSKRTEDSIFSTIPQLIEEATDESQILSEILDKARASFLAVDTEVRALLKKDLGVVPVMGVKIDLINDDLEAAIGQFYLKASDTIHTLFAKGNEEIIDFAQKLLGLSHDVVVAFYIGIYNGFLEALAGILTLIKWLFQAINASRDFLSDINGKFPYLMEVLDELMQAIYQFDFSVLFTAIGKGFGVLWGALVEKLSGDLLDTFCIISYFAGNIVGFVLELFVEIFFTGGIAAVAAFYSKLGRVGQVIINTAQRVFNLSLRNAGKGLLETLRAFIIFLNKSKEKTQQFVDEVFVAIKKLLDATKALHDNILSAFLKAKNISKRTIAYLEELGVVVIQGIYITIDGIPTLLSQSGLTIKYAGRIIREGSEASILRFFKKLDDIYNSTNRKRGKKGLKQELDEPDYYFGSFDNAKKHIQASVIGQEFTSTNADELVELLKKLYDIDLPIQLVPKSFWKNTAEEAVEVKLTGATFWLDADAAFSVRQVSTIKNELPKVYAELSLAQKKLEYIYIMILKEENTFYHVFHELCHFKHSLAISFKQYNRFGKTTLSKYKNSAGKRLADDAVKAIIKTEKKLAKELYVFEEVWKKRNLFNQNELIEARMYIKDTIVKANKVFKHYEYKTDVLSKTKTVFQLPDMSIIKVHPKVVPTLTVKDLIKEVELLTKKL